MNKEECKIIQKKKKKINKNIIKIEKNNIDGNKILLEVKLKKRKNL